MGATSDAAGQPKFLVPALQRYVAREAARSEKSTELRQLVPPDRRASWLERRKGNILRDYKAWLRLADTSGLRIPFKTPHAPEMDRIAQVTVVTEWSSFCSFITQMNLAFVETIDEINGHGYFFGQFKRDYPYLFDALLRIRVYRNNADHLSLKRKVEKVFNLFIEKDLGGLPLSSYNEPQFLLQQVVLDELFSAIQWETNLLA